MTPLRTLAPLPLLAACLLLAACSSPAPAQGPPSDAGDPGTVDVDDTPTVDGPHRLDIASVDACQILTRPDAEALIGVSLTEPLSEATSDVSSCTYPGDPNGPTGQVEIYIGPGAKQQLDIDRDQLGHAFTEAPGIGDEAWQEDSMIFARTGDDWISIRLVSLDDPAIFVAPLQSAMSLAVGRVQEL